MCIGPDALDHLKSEFPDFSEPPVIEVALAVQFEPSTVSSFDAALVYERMREEFPRREEQMARPAMAEDFTPPSAELGFRLELLPVPPRPRFWFLSDDESRLIQLQHDLLAVNWRRLTSGAEYPRYPALRQSLQSQLKRLDETLAPDRAITPNWCEVTYINHVLPTPGEERRPPLDRVFTITQPLETQFLPEPEDAQISQRFVIPGTGGPRGRLNVSIVSAQRTEDTTPIWVMTLTVRLRAINDGFNGALEALDKGREWAIHAFLDMTTPEMHRQWGLEKGEQGERGR